jgi:hypothetical protein
MIQVPPTSPVYFLPENLFSLLSRPGRELTVRVLQIEGKMLYLELGGDKFQAQIAGTFNPEDFKVGETLRVRVERTEPEIVLKLISPQKRSTDLLLMVDVLRKEASGGSSVEPKLIQEKAKEEAGRLVSLLREALIYAEKKTERKDKEEEDSIFSKIKVKQPVYTENKLLLPVVFPEGNGWGYFEFEVPEEKEGKTKLFAIRMFFPYLGLLEASFYLKGKNLQISIDFASKESLDFAKDYLEELKEALSIRKGIVNIFLQHKPLEPGYLLESRG